MHALSNIINFPDRKPSVMPDVRRSNLRQVLIAFWHGKAKSKAKSNLEATRAVQVRIAARALDGKE